MTSEIKGLEAFVKEALRHSSREEVKRVLL